MNSQFSRYYIFIKPVLRNKTIRTYGYFVFSIITTTIFVLFAIRPTFATIVSLKKSISEQQQILTQLDTKTKNLTQGKQNYENLDSEVKVKLLDLLPNSTNIPKLISILNSLATANEASISGVQFQSVELSGATKNLSKDAKLEEIAFTVNIQGSYPKLERFMNSFATPNRLLNIKSVNFNKSNEGDLVLSINAVAFFLKN